MKLSGKEVLRVQQAEGALYFLHLHEKPLKVHGILLNMLLVSVKEETNCNQQQQLKKIYIYTHIYMHKYAALPERPFGMSESPQIVSQKQYMN